MQILNKRIKKTKTKQPNWGNQLDKYVCMHVYIVGDTGRRFNQTHNTVRHQGTIVSFCRCFI